MLLVYEKHKTYNVLLVLYMFKRYFHWEDETIFLMKNVRKPLFISLIKPFYGVWYCFTKDLKYLCNLRFK